MYNNVKNTCFQTIDKEFFLKFLYYQFQKSNNFFVI